MQEQERLNEISEDIRYRLKFFTQADHLIQRLQNPTFSPASEQFTDILKSIDEGMDYLKEHVRNISLFILKV
jgi:Sec34-like family